MSAEPPQKKKTKTHHHQIYCSTLRNDHDQDHDLKEGKEPTPLLFPNSNLLSCEISAKWPTIEKTPIEFLSISRVFLFKRREEGEGEGERNGNPQQASKSRRLSKNQRGFLQQNLIWRSNHSHLLDRHALPLPLRTQ